jgi:hypothetical protein
MLNAGFQASAKGAKRACKAPRQPSIVLCDAWAVCSLLYTGCAVHMRHGHVQQNMDSYKLAIQVRSVVPPLRPATVGYVQPRH